MILFLSAFFLVFGYLVPPAVAETFERDFALPGDVACPIDLPETSPVGGWTAAERWTWNKICLGQWADLSLAGPDGDDGLACNPAMIESEVPAHRLLRSEFLQLVLTRDRWVEALAKPQVNIKCAKFAHKLDLENAKVTPELYLTNSHLPAGALLSRAHFVRSLSFEGSTFEDLFNGGDLSVDGSLFLQGGAVFKGVRLRGARVGGELSAIGSTFEGIFDADSILVGRSLFLRGEASFFEVVLSHAQVGHNVDASKSTFNGLFGANGLSVGGDLLLNNKASFQMVNLSGAQVGGGAAANGSTFKDLFNAYGLTIHGNMWLGDGASFQEIILRGAQVHGDVVASGSMFERPLHARGLSVGGNLFFRNGASFQEVNLPGASVSGHLQLSGSRFNGDFDFSGGTAREIVLFRPGSTVEMAAESDDPIWGVGAELILRNTQVEALQSRAASWQRDKVWISADLSGFIYDRLAGYRGDLANTLLDDKVGVLIAWLEGTNLGNNGYDPQPYEQLARVLDNAGMTTKANAVRFAKFSHRDLSQPGAWWDTLLLRPASRVVIGYGVYPFFALAWFGFLVALGFIVAFFSQAATLYPGYRKLWYSLENALPLVDFSEEHKVIDHGRWWVESWFHFQKVMGFVLATVLVGALSLLGG